jgi:hypothetical protein
MTERLAQLMRAEADQLDVPPPPAPAVLAHGRALRRRRRSVVAGVSTLALVAAAVTGFAVVREVTGPPRLPGDVVADDPAEALAAYRSEGAFAVGDDIYVGANHFEWKEAIKAVHYTSAGVVIQSGKNEDRDEGGSNYTLITPTGEYSDIDVSLNDQHAGFEPDSPYLAYSEPSGDGNDLVVRDVVDDREVARTHLDDPYSLGWAAPPVAIDGDLVWAHVDAGWTEFNWRTGDVRRVPETQGTHEIANGVYADWRGKRWVMRSMADSAEISELPLRRGWYGFLSPDGRYLRAFPNEVMGRPGWRYEVFEVATGRMHPIGGAPEYGEVGWTPDGHVMRLEGGAMAVCDPLSNACDTRTVDVTDGTVRIGGEPYAS